MQRHCLTAIAGHEEDIAAMSSKRTSRVSAREPQRPKPQPKTNVPSAAVISGSFLSGAMMSLSAFVIPVLLDTNEDAYQIVRQWSRLYHYGHIYLPALCIVTCGLYGYAALVRRSEKRGTWLRYALAAVSTIAMVPFTWVAMTPTNNTLFGLEASKSVTDLGFVRGLVVKWAWLHVTRSFSPLVGAILGFSGLTQDMRAM